MEMEKRLLAAIGLCIVIYVLYTTFFVTPPPPEQARPKPQAQQSAAPAPGSLTPQALQPATPSANAGTQAKVPASPATAAPLAGKVAAKGAPAKTPPAGTAAGVELPEQLAETVAPPQKVAVETKYYTVEMDNRGAVVDSFVLKDYHEVPGDKGVELIPYAKYPKLAEKADEYGHFLSILLPKDKPGDADAELAMNGGRFAVRCYPGAGDPKTVREVEFSWQKGEWSARKKVTFNDGNYRLTVASEVRRNGQPVPHFLRIGPGLTGHDLVPENPAQVVPHVVYYAHGALNVLQGADVSGKNDEVKVLPGGSWAGIQTKYFAAFAIPVNPFQSLVATNRVWMYLDDKKPLEAQKPAQMVSLFFPSGGDQPVNLFVGPKSYGVLSSEREELTTTIDYGWFWFIAKPLYYALKYVNVYVSNLGLCIIVLTFGITLALFPLRWIQMKSMKQMQKLQPQVKAVQAKYKGKKGAEDRQRLNAEVMQLYREAGVNPMGGCLPLVIQIPFLIAFYNLISQSIEFWRKPFVLWIHDLTAPDPTWITPILMGASMIFMMQQTPTPPGQDNRMQKMMMYVMPVLFTFMFVGAASGLVIYFLFSNVLSWGIQKATEGFLKDGAPGGLKAVLKPVKKQGK